MARRGKAIRLLRLWGGEWETWHFPNSRGEPVLVKGGNGGLGGRNLSSMLAMPARSVVAVPLWIDSIDPDIVAEMVKLNLDLRGMLPKKTVRPSVVTRTIDSRDGRTLVMASVFPNTLPKDPSEKIFDYYEASPLLLALPENAVSLWREGENLVAAFARQDKCVYWETIDFEPDPQAVSRWLSRTVMALMSEKLLQGYPVLANFLPELPSAKLPDADEAATTTLSERAHLPSLSEAKCEWKPPTAYAMEEKRHKSARVRRILQLGALAYVAFVLAVGGSIWRMGFDANHLRREVAQLQEETQRFEPTARQWKVIEPSVQSAIFPLEILHQAVKHMPDDGIRLTAFVLADRAYRIEGDATSASVASKYFSSLSGDPEVSDLRWEMAPPALLPNSAAHFQIQGKLR